MQRIVRAIAPVSRTARSAMYSTTGKFAEKEAAAEAQYVHEHDAELIAKLRKDLAKKTTEQAAAAAALEAAIETAPKLSPIDAAGLTSSNASHSAFSKKESANEENYFRQQDKEKLAKLKH